MRNLLTLLLLLIAVPVMGQGPIREVRYEFRHLAGTMPYADDQCVHSKVFFHELTQEKLIKFFESHPKVGIASQAQGYVNKLEADPMAEYIEKYLEKVDKGEGIDYATEPNSKWGYGGGVLYRHFNVYMSPTEKGWIAIRVYTHPTADVPVKEPKHPLE